MCLVFFMAHAVFVSIKAALGPKLLLWVCEVLLVLSALGWADSGPPQLWTHNCIPPLSSGPPQLWTHNCIPPLSSWHQMSLSVVTRSSTCVVSMMRWSQTTKLWRPTFWSGSERRSRSWTTVIFPTHSPEFRTCCHSLTVTGRWKNHQS